MKRERESFQPKGHLGQSAIKLCPNIPSDFLSKGNEEPQLPLGKAIASGRVYIIA